MRKQKIEVVENLNIANGNALKRVGALLIDVLVAVVLILLIGLVVTPIMNATSNFTSVITERDRAMKKSYLYALDAQLSDEQRENDTALDAVGLSLNVGLPATKQAEATYKFYTVYWVNNNSEINDEWYITNILKVNTEESIFVRAPLIGEDIDPSLTSSETTNLTYDPFIVEGVVYKTPQPSAEEINAFNKQIYSDALALFTDLELYKTADNLTIIYNFITVILSTSIVFLALPVFLPHGQTLGKMAFKLGLTTTHGYRVGPIQLLLRYFIFMIINVLSNIGLPFIFPFISLTVMVFNKKGRSLHDLAARTRVVDLSRSTIYDGPNDYLHAQEIVENKVRDKSYNEEVFAERFREDSGA